MSTGWAIDDERLVMYEGAFKKADANQDGFVEPHEIVEVLQRTKLPNEELSRIWRLSDADGDGRLNFSEFLCAVHVGFRRAKEGVEIPTTVPLELAQLGKGQATPADWPASSGDWPAPGGGPSTDWPSQSGTSDWPAAGSSADWPASNGSSDWPAPGPGGVAEQQPMPAFPSEPSNAEPAFPPPLSEPVAASAFPEPEEDWSIGQEEMARCQAVFNQMSAGTGYVESSTGRDLFERSGLPVSELIHIWQMSDVDQDGRLSATEFVRAMVIVDHRRAGGALPAQLPKELSNIVLTPLPQEVAAGSQTPSASSSWEVLDEEVERYAKIFEEVDSEGTGYVTMETGRELFESSQLPHADLGHIWQISDVDEDGQLAPHEFIAAMILVGKRRQGLSLPAVLPAEIKAAVVKDIGGSPAPPAVPAAGKPSGDSRGPYLGEQWHASKEELLRYRRIFLEKVNGTSEAGEPYIDGVTAKVVMDQSRLPVEDLCNIWALSDRNQDGILVLPEFLTAMSIVGRRLKGAAMPAELPRELINSIEIGMASMEGRAPAEWALEEEGEAKAPVAQTAVQAPLLESAVRPIEASQPEPAPSIDIAPEELEKYRVIFQQVDEEGKGALDAFQCREVFASSNLPVLELKTIFELADVDKDGKLWLGEFASAMALIGRRRQGSPLPNTLPDELLEVIATAPRPAAPPAPVVQSPRPVDSLSPAESPRPPPPAAATEPDSTTASVQRTMWSVSDEELTRYRAIFKRLDTANVGVVSADAARAVLQGSQLPAEQVQQIWALLGTGSAGLSVEQFSVAVVLASRCRQGASLPATMPAELRRW